MPSLAPLCRRRGSSAAIAAIPWLLAAAGACHRSPPAVEAPLAIHLGELYSAERVSGTPAPDPERPQILWRFDAEPAASLPAADRATRGWTAGPGVTGLGVADGRLAGRSTSKLPLLAVARTEGRGNDDMLHAIEVRLRVSAGSEIAARLSASEKLDFEEVLKGANEFPWRMTAPLVPGDELQTVTLTPRRPVPLRDMRHLLLRPTDAPGAEFAIESVRVISRREHLASIPSGESWQGLADVYRETLVARAPEEIGFDLTVPASAWLDLALGSVDAAPVTFRVAVRRAGEDEAIPLLERTLTTAQRWELAPIELEGFAGEQVTLLLALAAERPGAIGLWGSPVVRARGARLARTAAVPDPPQGVIVVWSDTTRRDHLSAYGYERDTTPTLRRLAAEGTLFQDCLVQATWTKVSTPSLMTGLYPTSHGVHDFGDRLPAAATTLAEHYRRAGYATLSLSSILFTGAFTNLHQGFEELHEDTSLPDQESSKTARIYVDRLLPWLEAHRDVPFFVFLHVADPHDPFEPAAPWDALWADPARKEEHERQLEAAVKGIEEPLLRDFKMPSRADLERSGADPDAFNAHNLGWYDGSIRGMDAELGRLRERLAELGLDRRTLLVYTADHGEEFLDHGRSFHGQGLYSELVDAPLIFWRPGSVPAGRVVEETVQTVDLMPTLLEASGLEVPAGIQGQSLLPLLDPAPAAGSGAARVWRPRPAFAERALTSDPGGPPPHDFEAYTVVEEGWKLIHNVAGRGERPEFELYRRAADPLDQHDVAAANPEVVRRLGERLAAWRKAVENEKLPADAEAAKSLSAEEIERLRSLGYLQ